MSNQKFLNIIVRDTENVIYQGQIDRISSFNEVGRFDVFPMHANFISIIQRQLTLYHKKEKVKELKIEQAILKVKKDEVRIFLGMEALLFDDSGLDDPEPPAETK